MNKPPYSPEITAKRKTGDEKFSFQNVNLSICLIDYWQWACSDILGNAERGKLAEFIVASALGIHYGTRTEWDPYDLKTKKGIKIEIKSSGYIQSWHQNKESKIIFGIQPTQKWNEQTGKHELEIKRQSDIYIFCVLAHKNPQSVNPLNLEQWEFYIMKTSVLNEHKPKQKTITLNSLKKLNHIKAEYNQLAELIEKISL